MLKPRYSKINKIESFTCQVLFKNKELYPLEIPANMYSFFGTNPSDYENGIIQRIRRDISSKVANMLIKRLLEKATIGEDLQVFYTTKRANGSSCDIRIDAYAGKKLPDGQCYQLIISDISELLRTKSDTKKLVANIDKTLLDIITNLPTCFGLYLISAKNKLVPIKYSHELLSHYGYTDTPDIFPNDACEGVHPEDVPFLKECIDKHLSDNKPFCTEYRIIHANGQYKWVNVHFNKFSLGSKQYLYGQYTDIDYLKKQEALLWEQYQAANNFMTSIGNSYLIARRANLTKNKIEMVRGKQFLPTVSSYVTYDASIKELLRFMPRKQDRKNCREFYNRKALIQAYAAGERRFTHEYMLTTPSCVVQWVRCVINLIKHPESSHIITFSTISDITKEKITETLANNFFIQQYDFVACLQAKTNRISILSVNTTDSDATEFYDSNDYESSVRNYIDKYIITSQRAAAHHFSELNTVLTALKKKGQHVGTYTISLHGKLRYKKAEFFFIDKESQLIAMLRSDFTEMQRQQLEQEQVLRLALADAQKANIIKMDFLSRLSHDIRTPLNGIIGMTYLAQEQNSPAIVSTYLDKISTSSKFLLGLINDILDISRAEKDRLVLHPEPYPLIEFTDYINSVIKPLCLEKNLQFKENYQSLPDSIPILDKLRINQVIFNLLSNAVKYTPESGTITCTMQEDILPGNKIAIQFAVADTGIGLSKDFQKKIFEPFTQANNNKFALQQDTGLGLTITKKLIDLMGGTITAHSKLGHGSTFNIKMVNSYLTREQYASYLAEKNAHLADYHLLKGKHILLCEDHPLNQQIGRSLLVKEGAFVEIAENGQQGLDYFSASPLHFYAAILMDIKMPVLDGYQATALIRKLKREDARKVPIIAMTADAFDSDIKQCLENGMNAHLPKPINPQQLYEILVKFMKVT